MYRSPNASVHKNQVTREVLVEASNCKYSHLLVCGDFNFPKIDWSTWSTNGTADDEDSKFIEALQDGFYFQHVHHNTRVRGANEPSLLDLILTNEDGMVSEFQSLVGKSDHALITFDYNCYATLINPPSKFMFNSGDYEGMRRDLSKVDWDKVIDTGRPVDHQWKAFSDKIIDSMVKHIPQTKQRLGVKNNSNKTNPMSTLQKATLIF